jgi:hypothetical protein
MKAWKPWAYLAAIALLFFAGDRLIAAGLDNLVERSDFRLSKIYRGGLDSDVVVIGNSRAVHAIVAPEMSEQLCRSVFNAAYNGMSMEVTDAVIQDYLDRNKPPQVALIEVSNATTDNNIAKEMRLFARSGRHLAELVEQLDPRASLWMSISHLYRFNNELTLRAMHYLGRTDQDWVMQDNPMTPEVIANLRPEWYPEPTMRPAAVAALKRIVHVLKARNVEPVLFIAPYHPVHQKLVPSYQQWVEALQREIGNDTKIINMSRYLTANEDFSDVVHMNIHGSRIVMSALAERLKTALPVQTASKCTYPSATVALSGIPAARDAGGAAAGAAAPAGAVIPR